MSTALAPTMESFFTDRLLCQKARQPEHDRVIPGVRREAPCCIPGAAGTNSKGCSWVQWLTRIRKVKGTTAC